MGELSVFEKQYLQSNQPPVECQEYFPLVEIRESFFTNVRKCFLYHIFSAEQGPMFWFSLCALLMGGLFLLTKFSILFGFLFFFPGAALLFFDTTTLIRAAYHTFLIKRLDETKRIAPYPVFFKLETQIDGMLKSLQSIVNSILERDWSASSQEMKNASESFITAVTILTERLRKYAELSLEVATLIWRNNIYAILNSQKDPQAKATAIGAKCREAEALLARYIWLSKLSEIIPVLKEYISNKVDQQTNSPTSPTVKILETFHLTVFGPVEEKFAPSFEMTPEEIPFKGKCFWEQRLPPFPLENELRIPDSFWAEELIKNLKAVRPLKTHLEEQVAINFVSQTISSNSPLEGGFTSAMQAKELTRDAVFEKFFEIPEFRPDVNNLEETVDKLAAEARVASGNEKLFDT